MLERRAQTGGAAITEEFHPGFRCSTLAHSAGPLRPDIVRDMQLEKHGLKMITPEASVVSLTPDGRALILYNDTEKSAKEIAEFSQKDAAKYPEFQASLRKMGSVIGEALTLAPPDIDNPSRADLWGMLKPAAPSASWARKICTACCAGDRWRSPILSRNISRPNCFAPPSPREESSEPSLDRGPQAAPRASDSRRRRRASGRLG